MASAPQAGLGSVVALWRYPVKSMLGVDIFNSDQVAS
jgi:uncharacterized protein YcbX